MNKTLSSKATKQTRGLHQPSWAKSIFFYLPLMLSASLFSVESSAGTIAYVNQVSNASGTLAPGQQYAFFGGPQPSSLSDFSITPVAGGNYPGNGEYSTVIAPGQTIPFTTGILYEVPTGVAANLLTFKITNPAITSFTFWVLDGNTDKNGVGNTSLSLQFNAQTPVAVNAANVGGVNEWTQFQITGASTSDVFTLAVTPFQNNHASVGGVTFATPSTVPEPSTLALVAIGVLSKLVSHQKHGKAH